MCELCILLSPVPHAYIHSWNCFFFHAHTNTENTIITIRGYINSSCRRYVCANRIDSEWNVQQNKLTNESAAPTMAILTYAEEHLVAHAYILVAKCHRQRYKPARYHPRRPLSSLCADHIDLLCLTARMTGCTVRIHI